MKRMKKLFSVVLMLALVMTILPTNVFAAKGSYSAYASKTTLTVGKSASLTITTKNAAGKFTVTSSNPAVAKVSNSSTWVDRYMDDDITIKGVSAGKATITITPVDVSDKDYNLLTNVTKITITVKNKQTTTTTTTTKPVKQDKEDKEDKKEEVKKSSDATLKSITLKNGKIDFKKGTTKYTVKVDKTVTSLGLKAVATDSKATVKITGDENFKTGENIVKIVVTAEDGTTKTYTITVIKSKYGSGPLLDLKVKGYEITPEFDPSETKYSVDVVGLTSVELEYVLADEDSTVTIEGADNLKVGKNEVKLTVTEADGTVTVYTVNVNVTKSAEDIAEKNNMIWIIIIIILVVLVIAEAAYIVYKNKKNK